MESKYILMLCSEAKEAGVLGAEGYDDDNRHGCIVETQGGKPYRLVCDDYCGDAPEDRSFFRDLSPVVQELKHVDVLHQIAEKHAAKRIAELSDHINHLTQQRNELEDRLDDRMRGLTAANQKAHHAEQASAVMGWWLFQYKWRHDQASSPPGSRCDCDLCSKVDEVAKQGHPGDAYQKFLADMQSENRRLRSALQKAHKWLDAVCDDSNEDMRTSEGVAVAREIDAALSCGKP